MPKDRFIQTYSQLRARSSATNAEIRANFGHDIDMQSLSGEPSHPGGPDIFSLEQYKPSPLQYVTDSVIAFFSQMPRRQRTTQGARVHEKIGIVVFALAMILVPVWLLHILSDAAQKLAMITSFIVFFALALGTAIVDKPNEVLISTAV